jgi:DNA replication protein DnaC
MSTSIAAAPSIIDRVKRNLVDLKMPRALEILDVTLRGIERGEMTALEAIDTLLAEELALRENRRVKMALQMARLSAIKTLAGFDFSFQPSLDKNRVMALAELQFIDRAEAVHLIGPPGTGKTHLSLALGVEAVKAGGGVYFGSLADIVAALARAERAARPAVAPCRRLSDRGVKLSATRARRPGARTHPIEVQHPTRVYTADAAPAWSAAKKGGADLVNG